MGSLAEWAMQWKRKGLLEKIVDPNLAGTINKDSLSKFAEAAEKCLAEHGVERPSMGDVLWNLEYALQLQDANPPVVATTPSPSPPPKTEAEDKTEVVSGAPATEAVSLDATVDNSSTAVANEFRTTCR